MKTSQHEERFSEDPRENLHIENQILKLKIQAQTGAFFSENAEEIPPEIESDFLKQVQVFEEAWQNVRQVSVYDLLDRPNYIKESLLTDIELKDQLITVFELLENHNMHLDILGDYAPREIYRFITEELFMHETDDLQLPGWTKNFIYEEFHPNHKMDIHNRAVEFLMGWFERKFNEYSWELNETFVLEDGRTISKKDILSKFNIIFESFTSFQNSGYDISDISFQWDERQQNGVGHAEGQVQYDAVMENGKIVRFEGSFKLYMSNEHGWWNIFYFIFPGFSW